MTSYTEPTFAHQKGRETYHTLGCGETDRSSKGYEILTETEVRQGVNNGTLRRGEGCGHCGAHATRDARSRSY